MNGSFWMGLLVGFLLGVVSTAIAIFLFFVPVRRDTTPATQPTTTIEYSMEPVVDVSAAAL